MTSKKKYVFKLEGMSCSNCALSIEKHLQKNNIDEFNINFANSELSVAKSKKTTLPALLNIGTSYDININVHRLTGAGTFTSNSFQKDQYRLGVEYSYKEILMLRGGYVAEDGIMNSKKAAEENSLDSYRTTALRGPSAGFTLELPMGNGSTFGLDYSYRHTNPFQGSHSIGARINL